MLHRRRPSHYLIALIVSGGISTAHASFTPNFYLGFENDLYRSIITPTEFPILSAGTFFDSVNDDAENESVYEYKGNLGIRISPLYPQAYEIQSQNLYWGEKDKSYESALRFSFGRRLIGWTKVDELWQTGIIEPIDDWDRLRPLEEGLTGVFAYTETRHLSFRLFLSYVFIPNTTPNIVINDDHQFVDVNPQSNANPPQTIQLLGQPTPLGYTLDVPAITKIAFRPSFMFMVETKKEIPIGAKFVYGYLPVNYFPVGLVGTLNIINDNLPITLSPRLINHYVYDGELSYRIGDSWSFGVVGLIDDPVVDTIAADVTTTPLSTSYTITPWAQFETSKWKVILTQIWVSGGLQADVGPNTNANGTSIFSSNLLYRNATQLLIKAEPLESSHHPTIMAKYVHEYSIIANWIALDLTYWFVPNFSGFVGGDLIGAARNSSPDRGAEFLADLRANDRIRCGVTYVF